MSQKAVPPLNAQLPDIDTTATNCDQNKLIRGSTEKQERQAERADLVKARE